MIACVRLPHFAAALEIHAHPDLANKPLVLVDDDQTVSGVSSQAAQVGIRAGMSLTQARAQSANVVFRPAVHSRTQGAFAELLHALTTFTAQVEAEAGLELRADGRQWRNMPYLHPSQFDDPPTATCYLDLGTLAPGELPDVARQLHRFVWEQTHVPVRMGLSTGKFPARVAAASVNNGDVLVVPRGQEADFLAGFTVALLPVDGETLRQMDLLGWYTLGDVAAQPVAALLDRFGKPGRIMHRLANGRDTSPVGRYEPPHVERITHQFEDAVADWRRLGALLDEMVTVATASIVHDGQTVRQITLVLLLEDGAAHERQVVLRQPTANAGRVRDVVLEMAQSLMVQSDVVKVELALSDIAPAIPKQLSLFDRPAVSEAHLHTVLKRLIARYGDGHFYWARAVNRDARLPERRYRREKADRP